jgi:DNA mismatch endonuclease, patch repair protein
MVDKISAEKRSKIMAAIHSNNTKPEVQLRRALWNTGLRYRVNYGPEKIDIAFPKKKIAVFVDGCFWHCCPLHAHTPKSNVSYWAPKLKRNVERDKAKEERLQTLNWYVIRVWEHDIKNVDEIVYKIISILKSN